MIEMVLALFPEAFYRRMGVGQAIRIPSDAEVLPEYSIKDLNALRALGNQSGAEGGKTPL